MGQTNSIPAINQKQEYQVKSKINKISYQIFVSLPKYYSKTDTTKYPVLYLLDGNYTFPIAHSTRQLLDFAGSIEDLIIVGIGYSWDKSYEPWYTGRWGDFTPSSDIKNDTSSTFLSMLKLKSGSLTSGNAKEFISILKNEIIPLVEKNYKVNGDKGLRAILWEVCLLLTVYYKNLNCLTDTASIAPLYGGTMKKYLKSKSLSLKKIKI